VRGGFDKRPSSPSPACHLFLLRHGKRQTDHEAVNMVLHMCERMAAGGIHDQLGGGFARYSVDAELAGIAFRKDALRQRPAFEPLPGCLAGEFEGNGIPIFPEFADGIVQYLLRDLTHPEGGFTQRRTRIARARRASSIAGTSRGTGEAASPKEFKVSAGIRVTEPGNS